MLLNKIVWTAVVSAVTGLGCLVLAGIEGEWTLGLGLVSIAAATLAAREK